MYSANVPSSPTSLQTAVSLAMAMVGSADIGTSSFDGNEPYCTVGSYRDDSEQVKKNVRHKSVIIATGNTGQQKPFSPQESSVARCS